MFYLCNMYTVSSVLLLISSSFIALSLLTGNASLVPHEYLVDPKLSIIFESSEVSSA
jgi:hypothetical protein